MISKIMRITLVVGNQEEALNWYTEKLGFRKRADFPMGPSGRWITVAPPDDTDLEMVLQPPDWFQGEERRRKAAQIGQNPHHGAARGRLRRHLRRTESAGGGGGWPAGAGALGSAGGGEGPVRQ